MRNSVENQRRYRAKHPEKIKTYNQMWRENHPGYKKEWDRYKKEEKEREKENPKKFRKTPVKKQLNINCEEYIRIFTEQEGKCAICGTHQAELKRALAVDHCHITNKIRGLLCTCCNFAIGLFKDDIENLRCAIFYLNKKR